MSAQPAAAEIIGNYIIERALAQGSMGHVYVARHQLTYARVALKVLRQELAADAHAEERFLREVRAAAQIGHDGIVKVLDAGCDQHGRLYLAMELLSGETLEERMAREPGERMALMRWIAHALPPLVAAHAQGIIHRDLKPANLFIALNADGTEELKLLDFGLARDTRQKSRTETGIALGTPYYMSPEQAMRPKEVGPATDVWALGVMMYEVLAGQMPFDGETLHAVVLQSSTRPHVPLASRQPELDPALCELVEDCLCKDPDMRPHDASALLARLFPLLDDPSICYQLEQPAAAARVASERSARNQVDPISYADTAITMPAPRINENEASYAPRRSTNTSVLVPIVLSIAMLGGAVIGYLRFAPASHMRDEQPAQVQQQASAAAQPIAAAATAQASPVQAAVAPVQAPPPAAAIQEPTPVVENNTSAARAQPVVSKAASKRAARGRRAANVELPLPSISAPLQSPVNVEPGPLPESTPEAPTTAAEWDKIDNQLQALPAQEPKVDELPSAPEAVAPAAPAPETAEAAPPPTPEPTPEATPQLELLPPPEPPVNL
ncbi:MAG TPA: serine/threonine-protein kinase [Polyangiales bacterium]|nr:serine/threonine-protein kinase [Polyangiales bacterium]